MVQNEKRILIGETFVHEMDLLRQGLLDLPKANQLILITRGDPFAIR